MIPRLVVAGTQSGVGKTTVATGLMAAFDARGLRVAPFKVGPDFIDPSYHTIATGRPGRNLDAFMSGPELIAPLFAHSARGCDLAVIEGVMGLFDGASGSRELASTAHVARLLDAPVLLVVDARAMSRSVAALVGGFAGYDPRVRIAGVVLNRVASDSHERTVRETLAELGVAVVGVLRPRAEVSVPERHLGLVPVAERRAQAARTIEALRSVVTDGCDTDAILRTARSAPPLTAVPWDPCNGAPGSSPVRVAVASGPAFTFGYEENLELLRARGVDVLAFDPTSEESLPAADALLIGGGFPEAYADLLSANEPLRSQVRRFADSGRPVAAECGGLLYLSRSLDGRPMCGVVDAEARMTERLTLGYRTATARAASPVAGAGAVVRGHEFHYSAIDPPAGTPPAWDFGERLEGFATARLHASYLHTHWAGTPWVADRLVMAASCARTRQPA